MFKVVTTEEMQRIEKAADAAGLTYDQMMTNAGSSIAEAILQRRYPVEDERVLILVGPGNNGGDGLVVGHHLSTAGAVVELYLSHPREPAEDHNFARLIEAGIKTTLWGEDGSGEALSEAVQNADMIIDALLGTGIKLPLRGSPEGILSVVGRAIDEIGDERPYIVAVDCPSGLDCDTGEISEQSLSTDLTVTLAAAKPGLFEFPGAAAVGELVIGSIGLPSSQPELSEIQHFLATSDQLSAWLPPRPLNAHKGTFGSVMVIAGSIYYPGAAALAAQGAYRSGAGLVALAVPSPVQALISAGIPEAIWIPLPHKNGVISDEAAAVLRAELPDRSALLIGPGFGREPATKSFLEKLLKPANAERSESSGSDFVLPPCVVDADGLKLISEIAGWQKLFGRTAILTPHPGEFALMSGLSVAELLSDRIRYAREFSRSWGHIIVLKGAYTHVAAPDGRFATIPVASPALATAGTGDVLAGVILALRGRGLDAFEAAVLGAYAHARAGLMAADDYGTDISVIASDVADYLPDAFRVISN